MKSGDARVALIGFPSVGKVGHQSVTRNLEPVSLSFFGLVIMRCSASTNNVLSEVLSESA